MVYNCVLCEKTFYDYGNSTAPILKDENKKCCDNCNLTIVIPYRYSLSEKEKLNKKQLKQKDRIVYFAVTYEDDMFMICHSNKEKIPNMTKITIVSPNNYVLVSSKLHQLTRKIETDYECFDSIDNAKNVIKMRINDQINAYNPQSREWEKKVYYTGKFTPSDYVIINLNNYND